MSSVLPNNLIRVLQRPQLRCNVQDTGGTLYSARIEPFLVGDYMGSKHLTTNKQHSRKPQCAVSAGAREVHRFQSSLLEKTI